MVTEIKLDETTLPKDGQKVKFFIPRDGWEEGEYLSKEQMFLFDGGKFHYAWEVSEWESV